jgi:hypothetical protein
MSPPPNHEPLDKAVAEFRANHWRQRMFPSRDPCADIKGKKQKVRGTHKNSSSSSQQLTETQETE